MTTIPHNLTPTPNLNLNLILLLGIKIMIKKESPKNVKCALTLQIAEKKLAVSKNLGDGVELF